MKPALLLLLLVLNLLYVHGVFRWKIAARKQRSTQRHKRANLIRTHRSLLYLRCRWTERVTDITDKWRAQRNQSYNNKR